MGYKIVHFRPSDILLRRDVNNINNLLHGLSTRAQNIDEGILREILRSSYVVIARLTDHPDDDGPIIGMITFHFRRLFTGARGYIDDLVVHQPYEGIGIGTELMSLAITEARAQGATEIDLTSNPKRERALALYKKFGFNTRDTNVLRLTL